MDPVSLLTLGLSITLGSFYTLVIGFGTTPFGLQETLGHLLLLASIWLLLRARRIKLSPLHYALLALAAGIAVYATITTGPLVRAVNTFAVVFVESFFLVGLFRTKQLPTAATTYVTGLIKYLFFAFCQGCVYIVTLQAFRPPIIPEAGKSIRWPSRETAKGIFLALPVLALFHIFFAQINSEYATYVNDILSAIWRIIKWIINIDFIILLGKLWISSYVFWTLFSVSESQSTQLQKDKHYALRALAIVLGATIFLFLLFSFFQGKLLFLNYALLAFKELSLYTQKGFWELVTVSIIGYSLCLFVFGRIKEETSETKRIKLLLTIFTIELIVITIFSYHKLWALQTIFGLKDQRILATTAVILITMTCLLFLGRLWGKIGASRIFFAQIFGLLGAALLFNIINIDLFITRTYPIRYYVNGTMYKDYSYLLGNSYDNTSEWLSLMKEAKEQGAPMPQEYYWGWYEPLCTSSRRSRYDTQLHRVFELEPVQSSYLSDRRAYVVKKYSLLSWRRPLPEITRVNLHEYQAFRLIDEHREEFEAFVEFAKTRCTDQSTR